MGHLQTIWDSLQQLIRIGLYLGGAALVTKGWITSEQIPEIVGYVLVAANGLWTVYWNRKQVLTVDGIKAASVNPNSPVSGAMAVEAKAVKA